MKFARLTERVAAGCCIDNQERLMRRSFILLCQRALHFLQFGHEIAFRVHAPGGVAQKKVGFLFCRPLVSVIAKCSGIRAVLTADHFNAQALRPNLKLLDRGRAKRVRRREENRTSILFERVREFGRRCRFAGAVHTDDQNDRRFIGERSNRF